jgi:hypothetical protein
VFDEFVHHVKHREKLYPLIIDAGCHVDHLLGEASTSTVLANVQDVMGFFFQFGNLRSGVGSFNRALPLISQRRPVHNVLGLPCKRV